MADHVSSLADIVGTFDKPKVGRQREEWATEGQAESLVYASQRAYSQTIAFLSTAAPRRGTLPDLAQQPSPKLFD